MLLFWDRISLCSPGLCRSCYMSTVGLKVTKIYLSLPSKFLDCKHEPHHSGSCLTLRQYSIWKTNYSFIHGINCSLRWGHTDCRPGCHLTHWIYLPCFWSAGIKSMCNHIRLDRMALTNFPLLNMTLWTDTWNLFILNSATDRDNSL